MADEAVVEVEDEAVVTVDVEQDDGKDAGKDAGKVEVKEEVDGEDPSTALAQAIKAAEDAKAARVAAETAANAERRHREDVERWAQRRDAEAQAAIERAYSSDYANIASQLEAVQRETENQQKLFQEAMEAGEFAKAGAVQVTIGRLASRLEVLEGRKFQYENNYNRRQQQAVAQPEPVMPSGQSAVEMYISNSFDPQAQAWLRAHPECLPPRIQVGNQIVDTGGKQDMNNRMMAGHYAALGKGYTLNGEDYFRTIEEHTGHRKTAEASAPGAAGKAKSSRAATPSAPVSREPPGSPPKSVQQVRLNKDQQEHARLSYPHLEPQKAYAVYAKHLIEATAEGKIGRLTH